MKLLNFQSQNVIVDWISFNIDGLPDVRVEAIFNPPILMVNLPRGFIILKTCIRFLSVNIPQRILVLPIKYKIIKKSKIISHSSFKNF